ncbi:MAG TPA: DUF2911 domain-containing protein [Terriglobia bacterium]
MRRLLMAICVFGFCTALAAPALAQGHPRATTEVTLGSTKVSVEYGKTSLGSRSVEDLLSSLDPDHPWRLGADKSTTFSTAGDLDFGGTTLPKGVYSLWARKEADNTWKLVFNTQHGQWGTDHDASKDAVAVPLKEAKEPAPADQVTIKLEKQGAGGEISIQWGDLKLSTDFKPK